jgi:hypothetical protein
MEGTAVKKWHKRKTLKQKGTKSKENMFRSFMEISNSFVVVITAGFDPRTV